MERTPLGGWPIFTLHRSHRGCDFCSLKAGPPAKREVRRTGHTSQRRISNEEKNRTRRAHVLSKETGIPSLLLRIVHPAVLCCRSLAATLSMRRVVPVRIMLIPTNVPITHSELDGHCRQTIRPRIKVTIPSKRIQPDPVALRFWK